MGFKLWGYAKSRTKTEAMELGEVTLIASPEHLRKIAGFLIKAADGIEQHGKKWEHEHLCDQVRGFNTSPQFIVFNLKHYKS